MKITCSGCDARYSVKDERIAGRSVKIRCKRCGTDILARGATAPPVTLPELFVLVGDDRRGPMSEDDLRALVAAGDVDGASLVWHAELTDWTPLAEIPALAALAATNEGRRAHAGASLFDVGGSDESPFASGESASDVVASSPSPARRPAVEAAATGARNESSLLFSLANLQDLATGGARAAAARAPAPRPVTSGQASAEGSGLIDIRALTAAITPTAPRSSMPTFDLVLSVGSPTAALGSPLAAPMIAAPPPSRGSSHALTALAALAAVTALALGGVAFVAIGRSSTAAARDASGPIAEGPAPSPEPIAPPMLEPPTSVPSDIVEVSVAPDPTPSAPERVGPAVSVRPRERPVAPPVARTEPTVTGEPTPTPSPFRPASSGPATLTELMERVTGADAPPATSHAATTLPQTPPRDDVRAAMDALAPAVRACASGTHGRALVSVVVAGSTGRARSATVGGDFTGTEAGSCIAGVVRRVELEPFARTTFTIAYPFAL